MPLLAALTTIRLRIPLRRPFVTAMRSTTELATLLVRAVDSDGRVGWGEAALSWRVTGESAGGARAAITGPIAEALIGRATDDVEQWGCALRDSIVGNAAARAAVDAALWDLAAQHAGTPLHTLLDPGSPRFTTTDMTISAQGVEHGLDRAAEHLADGFRVLKLKAGLDAAHDDRMVRALRSGPAADSVLRIDANQGWTAEEAIALIRGWEDDGLDVDFVEQPTRRDDVESLARVTAAVSTPILADESVWDVRQLRELIRLGAADMVNVKLAKCGGISGARDMISIAAQSGVRVLVGSMLESAVGIAAAAHLAVTLPPATHDLDAASWLSSSPVRGGLQYEGPRIELTADAGLGFSPEMEAAA